MVAGGACDASGKGPELPLPAPLLLWLWLLSGFHLGFVHLWFLPSSHLCSLGDSLLVTDLILWPTQFSSFPFGDTWCSQHKLLGLIPNGFNFPTLTHRRLPAHPALPWLHLCQFSLCEDWTESVLEKLWGQTSYSSWMLSPFPTAPSNLSPTPPLLRYDAE